MTYLTIAEANLRLERDGVNNIYDLGTLIPQIDEIIDKYLEKSLAPSIYEETKVSNYRGEIVLNYYPVLQIIGVYFLYVKPGLAADVAAREASWKDNNINDTIFVPFTWNNRQTIYVPENTYCACRYWAGYDPLPPEAASVAYSILKMMIEESLSTGSINPTLDELYEPTRDVASLSLPGGLSQSFQLGKIEDRANNNFSGTMLGRLLSPLNKYRSRLKHS